MKKVSPVFLWIVALFSLLLGVSSLFQEDGIGTALFLLAFCGLMSWLACRKMNLPLKKKNNQIILISIAATFLLSFGVIGSSHESSEYYLVSRIVDGDTIEITFDGELSKVRLIGVDTPESVHPNAEKNVEYGKIATAFTTDYLLNKKVELEFDVQERDQYGRLLAYVWIDGKMFNEILLENGHAKVATYPPNVKYVERFTKLQEEAREAGAGAWAYEEEPKPEPTEPLVTEPPETEPPATEPPETEPLVTEPPATEPPETEAVTTVAQQTNKYVGSIESDKFHKPSCQHAKKILSSNEIWFSSADDAKAKSYSPCGVCKPR